MAKVNKSGNHGKDGLIDGIRWVCQFNFHFSVFYNTIHLCTHFFYKIFRARCVFFLFTSVQMFGQFQGKVNMLKSFILFSNIKALILWKLLILWKSYNEGLGYSILFKSKRNLYFCEEQFCSFRNLNDFAHVNPDFYREIKNIQHINI